MATMTYSIWAIGPGLDEHVIEGSWESVEDAARAARSYARDDAGDGGTVLDDCGTSPRDLAAFSANRDDMPIYAVREDRR